MRSCEISDIESDLDYDEMDFMGHDELCSTPYRDRIEAEWIQHSGISIRRKGCA